MSNNAQRLPVPSAADVERIITVADPALRNLEITQCYHELSAVLAARTGLWANWCTFATWASRQAGQTIRKEDLARTIERVLGSSALITVAVDRVVAAARLIGAATDAGGIHKAIWEAVGPGAIINRTSDAVGRGNRKVFEEIGREFARFINDCSMDVRFDAKKVTEFCSALRPGNPPDGQQYLRQAFSHYYQSFFEDAPSRRAELQLLANIEIGFHEQSRLQPEIAESLDATLLNTDALKNRLIAGMFPAQGWLMRARLFVKRLWGGPTPLDLALGALAAEIRQQLHRAITEHLLTLTLPPNVQLRLGDDLPQRFPASLTHLAEPELVTLLAQLDPTPDSVRETGAVDWADLSERLHFIADLFRCSQETQELFNPPFTAEQLAQLRSGKIPSGRL